MDCGANTDSNYKDRANQLGLSCPSGYRSWGRQCHKRQTSFAGSFNKYYTDYTLRCIPYSTIDYGWVKK